MLGDAGEGTALVGRRGGGDAAVDDDAISRGDDAHAEARRMRD